MDEKKFWDKHDSTRTILLTEEDYEEYGTEELPETDNFYFSEEDDEYGIRVVGCYCDETDSAGEPFVALYIISYDPEMDEFI